MRKLALLVAVISLWIFGAAHARATTFGCASPSFCTLGELFAGGSMEEGVPGFSVTRFSDWTLREVVNVPGYESISVNSGLALVEPILGGIGITAPVGGSASLTLSYRASFAPEDPGDLALTAKVMEGFFDFIPFGYAEVREEVFEVLEDGSVGASFGELLTFADCRVPDFSDPHEPPCSYSNRQELDSLGFPESTVIEIVVHLEAEEGANAGFVQSFRGFPEPGFAALVVWGALGLALRIHRSQRPVPGGVRPGSRVPSGAP